MASPAIESAMRRRAIRSERATQSPSRFALRPLALLFLAGCLTDPGQLSFPLPPGLTVDQFVIDIAGDSLLPDSLVRLDLSIAHSGDHDTLFGTWTRVDATDEAGAFPLVSGTRRVPHWHLMWFDDSGDSVLFDGDERASVVAGQLRTAGRSASAQLLALHLDSAKTDDESLAGWFDPGPAAVVSIRADDSPDSDRIFIPELAQRQLMGEFAIITKRVGTQGFLRWDEVTGLAAHGYGIVAHSRRHAQGPVSLGSFAWEVAGAKSDLLAHGLYTRAIAIPGVWTGASYLDSVTKAQRARGRLAERFYHDTYAWVYPVPRLIPVPDSMHVGIAHVTADLAPVQTTMTILRAALRQQGYLQVLFHSRVADKENMRILLDSIAEFRDQGLITLVSSSVGLAARRDGAPKLRAAGGGPLRSTNVGLWESRPGACAATAASLDSTWIALDPGCDLWLTLRNPPQGTAAALDGMWRAANAGDSLQLSLAVEGTLHRSDRRTCVSDTAPSFCSVRLGVLQHNTTVAGRVAQGRAAGGRAWLNRFALSIR